MVNSQGNIISNATENTTITNDVEIIDRNEDSSSGLYIMGLSDFLKEGSNCTLKMSFVSLLQSNYKGFYKGVYQADDETIR